MNAVRSNSMLLAAAGAVVIGGLVTLPAGNARANLITNGDFSANASSFTTYFGYYDSSLRGSTNPTNATGWTGSTNGGVNGTDTGVGNIFGPTSTSISSGGTVADFAFLQGAPTAMLSQGFSATAGQAYTVSFVAATRAGDVGADMTAEVLDGSTVLGGIGTSTTVTPGSSDFTPYSFNFTADGGNLTFEILNSPPTGTDNSLAVSDVNISPVPEPASLGLAGAGVVGLLLIGRKRKQA